MNSYTRLSNDQVSKIIPAFSGEDAYYRLLPKSWFQKSRMEKLFGCQQWAYSLGGSDCGKFTLRLLAQIAERFADKYCAWGSSGGGGKDGTVQDERYGDHSDAPLLCFCKYLRRDNKWHIVGCTITEEQPSKPFFFERTPTDIREVFLSKEELATIKYARAY